MSIHDEDYSKNTPWTAFMVFGITFVMYAVQGVVLE
jgi:hypothetical protein